MTSRIFQSGSVSNLEIKSIIGFDGTTIGGFIVHPDERHVVYPLGNKVTIQNWFNKSQRFLSGHTNIISAIDVSRSGKYIASGQINHIGFKALLIVWNFETGFIVAKHELHKVRVESVAFSKDEQFCLSLGGRDCGSVVVWDLITNQALCGAQVSKGIQGEAYALLPMNRRGACFLIAGDNHLSVWKIDRDARNVRSINVNTAKLKRTILCTDCNERDEVCYCGTTTGDVLKIRLNYHHDVEVLEPVKAPIVIGCFAKISNKKLPKGSVDLYADGIRTIRIIKNLIIIGAGDGTVEIVEEDPNTTSKANMEVSCGIATPSTPSLRVIRTTNIHAAVTSIRLLHEHIILAATIRCEIFAIDVKTFDADLVVTCHTSPIYHISFPHDYSEIFATSGKNDVRVWSIITMQELLRISVPNFSCSAVIFPYDGKSILTAWNDGQIRSFTPITGRLIYAILNAHNKGVSALDTTKKGDILISGGCEGQVRVWNVNPHRQQLVCTLKEHKGPISTIHVNHLGNEAVSASTDGTCIIWDLHRLCRRQILFANTLFMCARYYPTGVQIITGGSDKNIAYWEVLDGSLVRELEGSRSGTINALDIAGNGEVFVSGGNDQIVKLWRYQEGSTTHIGLGHSSAITAAKFSPNGKYIVTTCGSGSIFVWKYPQKKNIIEQPEPVVETKTKPPSIKEENIVDLPAYKMESPKPETPKPTCICNKEFNMEMCVCSRKPSEPDIC